MATKASHELHHNFPKLAEESGFTFNNIRPRMHIDWNKIRLIDIEYLIKERKFCLIEQHMSDILNCALESEFDVRILNESVLKMFRLAQLAVEYQQFCRHYLDRSVYVLREEISSVIQELDVTKKDLREKDEEIRKLKRKSKHTYRTPLPYGNDNIANMILKTLTNRNDVFASTSNVDTMQYNKCGYCEKVFLNQLYLKSHLSRRHPNLIDTPENNKAGNIQTTINNNENTKLSQELMELKAKLKEMEDIVKSSVSHENKEESKTTEIKNNNDKVELDKSVSKIMKDAEVSTNNEDYLLDKIEEWKKEEHEKYNKELTLLRTQILETITSLKENDSKTVVHSDSSIVDQLHTTIRQQGVEILALKQELNDSKLKAANDNSQRLKEAEEQMRFWGKRSEEQTKQYELLLKKLNDVAKEAEESRNQAEQEKEKVAQLQEILENQLRNNEIIDDEQNSSDIEEQPKHNNRDSNYKGNLTNALDNMRNSVRKSTPVADRNTLEKLHLKAKELLSIASISSSSSDVSAPEIAKPIVQTQKVMDKKQRQQKRRKVKNDSSKQYIDKIEKAPKSNNNQIHSMKNGPKESLKLKELNSRNDKLKSSPIVTNGPIVAPRSPLKLVRSKITEEVNNRLVTAGMDPLKNRLPKTLFQKQRLHLQQQHELKTKKNPNHDNVRHTILAYLDSTVIKKDNPAPQEYVSPDKVSKFISLTSVLSNVKSKALSLVKSNDNHVKRKSLNADMAKRVMSLLKTPPGSLHSSPIIKQHSPVKEISEKGREFNHHPNHRNKNNIDSTLSKNKIKKRQLVSNPALDTSNSDSGENDHKYYKAIVQQTSKSVENLIKSPARKPVSANSTNSVKKYAFDKEVNLHNQSEPNLSNYQTDLANNHINDENPIQHDDSSDDAESLKNMPLVMAISDENIHANVKQTKGVLKNASSMSSLNKKKVLFDMDAIQMKSVSASPSQSITEKSDSNEKYELGLVNLDGEEWDISSIENEPLKTSTKIQVNTRTSPKIAELKQTIESQLARRNETPSTVLVGGIDVLSGQIRRASSVGGSNTSLGSSILDDSDSVPAINHKAFVKPKHVTQKDDSELDISEFSIDGLGNKNEAF